MSTNRHDRILVAIGSGAQTARAIVHDLEQRCTDCKYSLSLITRDLSRMESLGLVWVKNAPDYAGDPCCYALTGLGEKKLATVQDDHARLRIRPPAVAADQQEQARAA